MDTQILLENPDTKKEETYVAIEKVYGKKYADILHEAKINGEGLTFNIRRQCRLILHKQEKSIEERALESIHSENIQKDKQKRVVEPVKIKNKYEGQFVQVPFGLYRNKELYLILNECLPIYTYLQSCVFRGEHSLDKHNLYKKFYRRGILAVSVPTSEIARIHGHGRNKARERLDLLLKYKFIKKTKIPTKYKKKGKWLNGQQNVFILGTHFMGTPIYMAGKINFCEAAIDKG